MSAILAARHADCCQPQCQSATKYRCLASAKSGLLHTVQPYDVPVMVQMQVQRPAPAFVDDQTTTPNFKRFRKLQPSLAAHNTVPFSTKGYAENNIDSEAFLKWVAIECNLTS